MFLYENSGEILHKNYPVHPVNPCRSAPHECVFGYRKVQQEANAFVRSRILCRI